MSPDIDGPIFIIRDKWGICRDCGERQDLRAGVCFGCALRAEEGLPPKRDRETGEQHGS